MVETNKLIATRRDRVLYQELDGDTVNPPGVPADYTLWRSSDPIPGARLISFSEIYHNTWLVLSVTTDQKYRIYRSLDRKKYDLVHEHDVPIHGIFVMDAGMAVFSADDGWFITDTSGTEWTLLTNSLPTADNAIIFGCGVEDIEGPTDESNLRRMLAYGTDRKLYYYRFFPDEGDCEIALEWDVALDTTSLWQGTWYPALAGSVLVQLVGIGNMLYRSEEEGTWDKVNTVDGIIKDITIIDKSNFPGFIITVESEDGSNNKIYWTYDLGDTLTLDSNRLSPNVKAVSIVPTGGNHMESTIVITGKRSAGGGRIFQLVKTSMEE